MPAEPAVVEDQNQALIDDQDNDPKPEPPAIPCIVCMEQEAVIITLVCRHVCFCLGCYNTYEEGGIQDALLAGKGLFVFLGSIIEVFFFLCAFYKKINTIKKNQ